jgi:mono/diheme cytochrome c family protein
LTFSGAAQSCARVRGSKPTLRVSFTPGLRLRSVVTAVLLLLLTGSLTACADAAGPEQPMSGKQIYDRQCARCHGPDGRPTKAAPTARDLTNRSYIDELGDKRIREAIMQGRPQMTAPGQVQMMPAFGNQFSEPELQVLIGYVRSLSNPGLGPDVHVPEAVQARPGSGSGE